MIVLPDMMSWPHFIQMPKMRNLPIHEQTRLYNQYLAEQQAMYAQVMAQVTAAGSGGTQPVQDTLPSNCIEFTVDTTSGTEVIFDFTVNGLVNYTIVWGDGNTEEGSVEDDTYTAIHTYPESEQQYTASICFDNPSGVTSLEFVGNN